MERSDSITKLAPALLLAQQAIGAAVKGSENPHFKYTYADLAAVIGAVKRPLNDNGIVFLQGIAATGEGPCVYTMLLHTSGEFISTATPVYCAKQNDPQSFGSGVTYSKRYALQSLLGLPSEDDDGEGAMARNAQPDAREKPPVDPGAKAVTSREDRTRATKLLDAYKVKFENASRRDVIRWAQEFFPDLPLNFIDDPAAAANWTAEVLERLEKELADVKAF